MADGSLPGGEVKVRFSEMPSENGSVPGDRAMESALVCAMEARVNKNDKIARVKAIRPRVRSFFIAAIGA